MKSSDGDGDWSVIGEVIDGDALRAPRVVG